MTTIRIFFEKCGEAAYISLLDLQRVFHRMLKMSSLPVYYTQGFNPHIYLSFSCPLSLGQESLCESCEVKTEQETIDPQTWIDALQPLMPRGIVITKIAPAVEKVGEIETAAYEVTMPASSAIALDAYNNAEHAEVTKKTKRGQKTLELKNYLDRIAYTVEGDTLRFTAMLPCGSGEALSLNPSLLTDFLRTQGPPRSGSAACCARTFIIRRAKTSSKKSLPPQRKAKVEKIFDFLSKPPCQTSRTMI